MYRWVKYSLLIYNDSSEATRVLTQALDYFREAREYVGGSFSFNDYDDVAGITEDDYLIRNIVKAEFFGDNNGDFLNYELAEAVESLENGSYMLLSYVSEEQTLFETYGSAGIVTEKPDWSDRVVWTGDLPLTMTIRADYESWAKWLGCELHEIESVMEVGEWNADMFGRKELSALLNTYPFEVHAVHEPGLLAMRLDFFFDEFEPDTEDFKAFADAAAIHDKKLSISLEPADGWISDETPARQLTIDYCDDEAVFLVRRAVPIEKIDYSKVKRIRFSRAEKSFTDYLRNTACFAQYDDKAYASIARDIVMRLRRAGCTYKHPDREKDMMQNAILQSALAEGELSYDFCDVIRNALRNYQKGEPIPTLPICEPSITMSRDDEPAETEIVLQDEAGEQSPDMQEDDGYIYSCVIRGSNAKARRLENGTMIVLKGSRLCPDRLPSCPSSVITAREKYADRIRDGVLLQDIEFKTVSGASGFVIFGSSNGNVSWKTEDGRTLGEVYTDPKQKPKKSLPSKKPLSAKQVYNRIRKACPKGTKYKSMNAIYAAFPELTADIKRYIRTADPELNMPLDIYLFHKGLLEHSKKIFDKYIDWQKNQKQDAEPVSFEPYNGDEPFIFVSYAHNDEEVVGEIINGLIARGYRVWYDVGIETAAEWDDVIEKYIDKASLFLAFLSPGFTASKYCRFETKYAITNFEKQYLGVYLAGCALEGALKMYFSTIQCLFAEKYDNIEELIDKIEKTPGIEKCRKVKKSKR